MGSQTLVVHVHYHLLRPLVLSVVEHNLRSSDIQAMSNATLNTSELYADGVLARPPKSDPWLAAGYGVLLGACFSVWVLAIRAPFWVDETLSYWQIAGGFKQIWTRSVQGNSFAAYAYILWLTNGLFGNSEVVLRIPSVLAMLAAVYVFYRCARMLFAWDVALIATVFFMLPRAIAFAAIDVRPYAFALLLSNLTILAFLRWTKTTKTIYSALMGASAAGIIYFHYLFATVLVALAIYYLLTRGLSKMKADLPQTAIALGCFVILLLPVLPRLWYIYQSRVEHSSANAPRFLAVLHVLNPGKGQWFVLAGVVLMAAVVRGLAISRREVWTKLLLCLSLTLVPILSLYAISVMSSVHIFLPRYLLAAAPGIALCWGWFSSCIKLRPLRGLFCLAFAALCTLQAYGSVAAYKHEVSWKGALAFADENASRDHAPLLMCSPLVEADFQPMPAEAKESVLYAPLIYYKVKSPVVPLPRTLNEEADRQVRQFLQLAAQEHLRFLVLAPGQSVPIADLLASYSQGSYSSRVLGVFDNEIMVVEFTPYSEAH
jgi:hypothetical protein